MPALPPGGREREILTAIVETFIASGEPVGSRTLARSNREGLSAATIRNVMADLADAGFLEQPHTSAGRVPTAEAYRYYVEQLSGEAHLSPENQSIIQGTLAGVTDVEEFMERTSHVLSLISHSVGVTVATSGPQNALEHVYFSRLGDQKVLAVVVTRSGVVRDRVLRLDIPQADLDLAARYINENFRGWTMGDMRAELARRIEQERSEYDRLMKSIEQLYQAGRACIHRRNRRRFSWKERRIWSRTAPPGRKIARVCRTCCGRSTRRKKLSSCSALISTRGRRRCGW